LQLDGLRDPPAPALRHTARLLRATSVSGCLAPSTPSRSSST
jgi:hypothetical protein